ncbi:hypothetical protein QQ045_015537 [Rhodiola kirilowii]
MNKEDINGLADRLQGELYVSVDEEEWDDAEKDYSNALVLKLATGEDVNFKGLSAALRRMWTLKGKYKEDMEKVYDAGPWQFDDVVLLMNICETDCAPGEYTFNRLGIWAQFHNAPIGASIESVIRKMANKVGEFCKVDKVENADRKCNFLRCRVWIDPTKPIVTGLYIERRNKDPLWVTVRYEKLPMFCLHCGRCMHGPEGCTGRSKSKSSAYEEWLRRGGDGKRIIATDEVGESSQVVIGGEGRMGPAELGEMGGAGTMAESCTEADGSKVRLTKEGTEGIRIDTVLKKSASVDQSKVYFERELQQDKGVVNEIEFSNDNEEMELEAGEVAGDPNEAQEEQPKILEGPKKEKERTDKGKEKMFTKKGGGHDNPISHKRAESWELLRTLSKQREGPWLVLGDFNKIMFGWESKGRKLRREWRMRSFREAIEDCDHYPLLVEFHKKRMVHKKRLFRFEPMWLRHEGYPGFIDSCWRNEGEEGDLLGKLKGCRGRLAAWNKTVFGRTDDHVSKLKAELERVKGQFRSQEVIKKEARISKDLEEWLAREELFWRQRSRVEWLREGDANTKIKEEGKWITEEEEICKKAMLFFEDLYKQDIQKDSVDWGEELGCVKVKLSDEACQQFSVPFTATEVQEAAFQLGSTKAPGIDGFSALFYQKSWEIVKGEVFHFVLKFLNEGELDPVVNETLITLVPKVKTPVCFNEYRTISLVNIAMKIITKAMANRMKRVLAQLISVSQSAFIPGRLISVNILLAHELMHYIKTRREGGAEFCSIKLDMRKAYDRVDWTYLEQMQLRVGFPVAWVDKDQCLIRGVKVSRDAPMISNLMFADDSILFVRAEIDDIMRLKSTLVKYEELFGQQVNLNKSEICIENNVSSDKVRLLRSILGMNSVNRIERYLGLPICFSRRKAELFSFVESRIWKKVNGWKEKLLSAVGKETLIKSVIQSIPIYDMACFKFPKGLSKRLFSLVAKFWWNDAKNKRYIAWVGKEKLCRPKEEGGLAFKPFELVNDALLAKQIGRILSCPDLLISRVYKARYFPRTDISAASLGTRPSWAWRSLHKAMPWALNWFRPVASDSGIMWQCQEGQQRQIVRNITGEASNGCRVRNFWHKLWRIKVQGKVKIFMWRLFNNALPSACNLISRGCEVESRCLRCGYKMERTSHIFLKCWWSVVFWRQLLEGVCHLNLNFSSVEDWDWYCVNEFDRKTISYIFYGARFIWYARNVLWHNGELWDIKGAVWKVKSQVSEFLEPHHRFVVTNHEAARQWSPPAEGFIKVNCDGAWDSIRKVAGYGFTCRDHEGMVVLVGAGALKGLKGVLEAEGVALCRDMKEADRKGWRRAVFVSDNLEEFQLLLKGSPLRILCQIGFLPAERLWSSTGTGELSTF